MESDEARGVSSMEMDIEGILIKYEFLLILERLDLMPKNVGVSDAM